MEARPHSGFAQCGSGQPGVCLPKRAVRSQAKIMWIISVKSEISVQSTHRWMRRFSVPADVGKQSHSITGHVSLQRWKGSHAETCPKQKQHSWPMWTTWLKLMSSRLTGVSSLTWLTTDSFPVSRLVYPQPYDVFFKSTFYFEPHPSYLKCTFLTHLPFSV